MRWEQGRAALDAMLSRGEIEKVTPSRARADELLDQAARHLATIVAQLDPPLGKNLRPFDRMRRRRNEAEYPRPGTARFGGDEVLADLVKVEVIRDVAVKVLDQMPPY